jgi:SWI/SNF-related matrix-associated actin-dependent regulator of chromatin subfamily A member 5
MKNGRLMKAIRRIIWNTVILDEGHRIKNDESQQTRAAIALKSRFKLILTGTPVQNNLHESYVLLSFLFPTVFTDSKAFDEAFNLSGGQQTVHVKGKLVSAKR